MVSPDVYVVRSDLQPGCPDMLRVSPDLCVVRSDLYVVRSDLLLGCPDLF